jgi:hypothetical protein
VFEIEREPPPPRAMAGQEAVGTVPCPRCGRTVPYRPGTYGHVIAMCGDACGNTLVATHEILAGTLRPAAGGGAHHGGA